MYIYLTLENKAGEKEPVDRLCGEWEPGDLKGLMWPSSRLPVEELDALRLRVTRFKISPLNCRRRFGLLGYRRGRTGLYFTTASNNVL